MAAKIDWNDFSYFDAAEKFLSIFYGGTAYIAKLSIYPWAMHHEYGASFQLVHMMIYRLFRALQPMPAYNSYIR
jgi:hypothetical protein